jgi:hypothetical protein
MTKADRDAYHVASWLAGGVISSISEFEFPMVDKTTIVCFESHLIAGLAFIQASFSFQP